MEVAGVGELLMAYIPDAIEECGGEAIDGEEFSCSIAEVYHHEHVFFLNLMKFGFDYCSK